MIAYGEVLFFNGSVTSLTLVSFALMVVSSIIAASGDISAALSRTELSATVASTVTPVMGYLWMFVSLAYERQGQARLLTMSACRRIVRSLQLSYC